MNSQKVLAIAAANGRVGYVFLVGISLRYWQVSDTASRSPEHARRYAKDWIDTLRPDVVVTEKVARGSRKGEQTRKIIAAIAGMAEHELLYDVSVARPRRYKNKYDEATALAERFPELKRFVPPPRRLWDSEHRNTTIFEALTLALEVIELPQDHLEP